MQKTSPAPEHFVYLYRDRSGKPRYVGYGKQPQRAAFHATGSHNESLATFLKKDRYSLEIAGPFGSRETALAVETALISALCPLDNINKGKELCRFRPYGVPSRFADRLTQEPLGEAGLIQATKRRSGARKPSSILFVYINERDFEDGREGLKPARPLSDRKLLQRIEKWWQIGRLVKEWQQTPAQSPALLVAVSGKPQSRIIAAAVTIDRTAWAHARSDKDASRFYQVPTKPTPDLDACRLRGRRIKPDAALRFGTLRHQVFLLLNPDGTREGGA